MVKALLLDMDGLLIDSEKYSYQVYVDYLKERGIDFSLEFYIKKMCGSKAIDNVKTIIKEFNLDVDLNETFEDIVERERKYFNAGIPLKKGALELFDYCKQNNIKLILATSSLKDRAMIAINHNNIDHYFDDKVFGIDVKHGKPAPDLFLKACEKAKCNKEECIVLEDAEKGIESAYNGGIPVICVSDIKPPKQEYIDKCIKVCDSLLDVIDYIKTVNN